MAHELETIISLARDLPSEERAAYLDEAAGGDAARRAQLDGLLAQWQEADAFFDEPATIMSPRAVSSESEGTLIGPYKLLQQIGEGGFGTVWMAEQQHPVRRRVALKIIKAGMDTKEVIARFESERQAVAMMDHPNIAKVLDAGATEKERPFFVMELVKGKPITQYCDEAGLGTRERLALFGDVCSAINHAHQKGVIHRDIKPSNVMVTLYADKPVVKVIDFGIAKATQGKLTDKTIFTRFEQFIGTPVYMSPEQASMSGLDVDTRSDIYALGILLYELLTGKPPFDAKSLISAGYEEMRRIIREVEPVKPSSRLSTMASDERTQFAKARHIEPEKLHHPIEPDLDWIVMKAIEKDRSRRYETANAFAQDIVRFLADELVSATPPSAGYQFRKFARRNKAALRVAAAIAAVLVAATLVSTWQAIRATNAENKTAETLIQVTTERDAKEQARKDAEEISEFLIDVFESPDPSRDGRTITVAETLDRATKKLDADLTAQPDQRATLQGTLGLTYRALGLARQAIPLQEKVRDYHLATFGPEHPDTLSAMNNLANSYSDTGRQEAALKLREEVLTLRRKVTGPEHPDTLTARSNLANSYDDTGRQEEALKLREEVLTLRRKVLGSEHPNTLSAMHNLAISYHNNGRQEEALKLREELQSLHRKVNGPEHSDTLATMGGLALSYSHTGRHEEAIKIQEEVLALSRKVTGPEHPATLLAMSNLALSYSTTGRHKEALKIHEEALALRRKVLGPEHPDMLDAMSNLALSYSIASRQKEELKLREEVLALRSKLFDPEHPTTLGDMTNLAICYAEAGRLPEAVKLQEQSLSIKRRVLPPNHPFFAIALKNMASLYEKTDRKDEAAKLWAELEALKAKKYVELRELRLVENPADSGFSKEVALLYLWQKRFDDHTGLCRKILETTAQSGNFTDWERGAKACLVRPDLEADLQARAVALAHKALAAAPKDDAVMQHWCRLCAGMASYREGKDDEADQYFTEATRSANREIKTPALLYRGMSRLRKGRIEEATADLKEAELHLPPLPEDRNTLTDNLKSVETLLSWLVYEEAKEAMKPLPKETPPPPSPSATPK